MKDEGGRRKERGRTVLGEASFLGRFFFPDAAPVPVAFFPEEAAAGAFFADPAPPFLLGVAPFLLDVAPFLVDVLVGVLLGVLVGVLRGVAPFFFTCAWRKPAWCPLRPSTALAPSNFVMVAFMGKDGS